MTERIYSTRAYERSMSATVVATDRDDGRVLRYVARVREGAIRVGPEAVDPDDPLGILVRG